jgi:membrane protein required for colicin V production
MTALDILVLLLVGGTALLGFKRGLTTEMLSLAAWVVAIAAVKVLHAPVTELLTGLVKNESGAAVLAFSLIFGLAMWLGRMLARKVGEQTKASALGLFDRILGGGFGATKGLIGACIAFLLVSLFYNTLHSRAAERPKWMTDSKSYVLLSASSKMLVDLVEKRQAAVVPSPNSVITAGD